MPHRARSELRVLAGEQVGAFTSQAIQVIELAAVSQLIQRLRPDLLGPGLPHVAGGVPHPAVLVGQGAGHRLDLVDADGHAHAGVGDVHLLELVDPLRRRRLHRLAIIIDDPGPLVAAVDDLLVELAARPQILDRAIEDVGTVGGVDGVVLGLEHRLAGRVTRLAGGLHQTLGAQQLDHRLRARARDAGELVLQGRGQLRTRVALLERVELRPAGVAPGAGVVLIRAQVHRVIGELARTALGPGLVAARHRLHVIVDRPELQGHQGLVTGEGILVEVVQLAHELPAPVGDVLGADVARRKIRLQRVDLGHQGLHPGAEGRIGESGDLGVQAVVQRQGVDHLAVDHLAAAAIEQIGLHAQRRHGFGVGLRAQVAHQTDRVAVEVAVEGLHRHRVDGHARQGVVDDGLHVAHAAAAQHRVAPDHHVAVDVRAELLGHLRVHRDLVDVQARVARPHRGGRVGHPVAHHRLLEHVALVVDAPGHNVTGHRVVGVLRSSARLLQLGRQRLRTHARFHGGLVVDHRAEHRHVLPGVIVARDRAIAEILLGTQVGGHHRQVVDGAAIGPDGLGGHLAGGHLQRERQLHQAAGSRDRVAEGGAHGLVVDPADRSTLGRLMPVDLRDGEDLALVALDGVMAHPQFTVRGQVVSERDQVLAHLGDAAGVGPVEIQEDLVATLGLQRPCELAGRLAALALAHGLGVVDVGLGVDGHVRDDQVEIAHRTFDVTAADVQVAGIGHQFAGGAAVEARDRRERAHHHLEFRIGPEELHFLGQAGRLGLVIAHVAVDDEGDHALVAVEVGELVADLEIAHVAAGVADLVLGREIGADDDAVLEIPAVHLRHRRAHAGDDRRGLHDVGERHVLAIVRVIAHLGRRRHLGHRDAIGGVARGDHAVFPDRRRGHQITHHALVAGHARHDRIEHAGRSVGVEHRDIAPSGQRQRVAVVVIAQIRLIARRPGMGHRAGTLAEPGRVTHPQAFGRQNRFAVLAGQTLLRRHLEEVDRVPGVVEVAHGPVDRGRLTDFGAVGEGDVVADLIAQRIGHDSLVALQPRALLQRLVLPRRLGDHRGLVTGHEHVVFAAGELRDDLAMLAARQDLADVAHDVGTAGVDALRAPFDHAVFVDLHRRRPRTIARERIDDNFAEGGNGRIRVFGHVHRRGFIELDQPICDRHVVELVAAQFGSIDLRAPQGADDVVAVGPDAAVGVHEGRDHRRVEALAIGALLEIADHGVDGSGGVDLHPLSRGQPRGHRRTDEIGHGHIARGHGGLVIGRAVTGRIELHALLAGQHRGVIGLDRRDRVVAGDLLDETLFVAVLGLCGDHGLHVELREHPLAGRGHRFAQEGLRRGLVGEPLPRRRTRHRIDGHREIAADLEGAAAVVVAVVLALALVGGIHFGIQDADETLAVGALHGHAPGEIDELERLADAGVVLLGRARRPQRVADDRAVVVDAADEVLVVRRIGQTDVHPSAGQPRLDLAAVLVRHHRVIDARVVQVLEDGHGLGHGRRRHELRVVDAAIDDGAGDDPFARRAVLAVGHEALQRGQARGISIGIGRASRAQIRVALGDVRGMQIEGNGRIAQQVCLVPTDVGHRLRLDRQQIHAGVEHRLPGRPARIIGAHRHPSTACGGHPVTRLIVDVAGHGAEAVDQALPGRGRTDVAGVHRHVEKPHMARGSGLQTIVDGPQQLHRRHRIDCVQAHAAAAQRVLDRLAGRTALGSGQRGDPGLRITGIRPRRGRLDGPVDGVLVEVPALGRTLGGQFGLRHGRAHRCVIALGPDQIEHRPIGAVMQLIVGAAGHVAGGNRQQRITRGLDGLARSPARVVGAHRHPGTAFGDLRLPRLRSRADHGGKPPEQALVRLRLADSLAQGRGEHRNVTVDLGRQCIVDGAHHVGAAGIVHGLRRLGQDLIEAGARRARSLHRHIRCRGTASLCDPIRRGLDRTIEHVFVEVTTGALDLQVHDLLLFILTRPHMCPFIGCFHRPSYQGLGPMGKIRRTRFPPISPDTAKPPGKRHIRAP